MLAGYAGSDKFDFLSLRIYGCNSTVEPNCDTPVNIATYVSNYISFNDYFKVKLYLLDTIITPSNHEAISYVIEKNIFLAFSTTMGTVGHINMAEFELLTD